MGYSYGWTKGIDSSQTMMFLIAAWYGMEWMEWGIGEARFCVRVCDRDEASCAVLI